MKKKMSFFSKLKRKFSKSEPDFDEKTATDFNYEISEDDLDSTEQEVEEDDEEFVPQQMQLSEEEKEILDESTRKLASQKNHPIDATQEIERPDETSSLSQQQQEKRLQEIEESSYDEEDFEEHSGINTYKEFEIPKEKEVLTAREKMSSWLSRLQLLSKNDKKRDRLISKFSSRRNFKGTKKTSTFGWDDFVNSIFSVENRPKIHRSFLFILICLFSYATGKSIGLYLDDDREQKSASRSPILEVTPALAPADLRTITSADLFNASPKEEEEQPEIEVKPKVDENLICLSAQKSSTLPIQLKNTVVLQDSVKSVASVQVRGQKEVLDIREGQKITNLAEVGRIDRQKLIFKNLNSGECEFVQNQDDGPAEKLSTNVVSREEGQRIMDNQADSAIKNEGNSFKIKKGLRDEMLSNISEVLTQARAVQIQNPDGSYSFKMTEIVPGSIYSKLNIQDGDIVEQVDGEKIRNLNELMKKFGNIREIDNLSLTIKRDGSSQTYDYSFE